jgi:hypothetical protein
LSALLGLVAEGLGKPESETTIGRDRVCLDYVVTDGRIRDGCCFRGDQLENSGPWPE